MPPRSASLLPGLRVVVTAAGKVPVSAFSLADLQAHARASGTPLLDLLREIRHAGVTSIAEAPIDVLDEAESALEAVREAGLGLARLTVHRHTDAAGARRAHPAGRRASARPRLAAELRAAAAVVVRGVADHRLRGRPPDRPRAAAGRQHPVHPGGLVALRPEAGAGGADLRRRRSGRGVGRWTTSRTAGGGRRSRRSGGTSRPPRWSRWNGTAPTGGSADEAAPPRRGRVPQRAPARVRPRTATPIDSTSASTSRRAAPNSFMRGQVDVGLVPVHRVPPGRVVRRGARRGHRIGRPGGVGGGLQPRADRPRAHGRPRCQFAHVGGPVHGAVRAPLRHRAGGRG